MKNIRILLIATAILLPHFGLVAQTALPPANKVRQFYNCFSILETPVISPENLNKLLERPPCFEQNLITNPRRYLQLFFIPEILQKELTECYFTQSNLLEVMQMYNRENPLPMRRISDSLIIGTQTPLIPRYLKHPFFKPTPYCHYESTGDITRNTLKIFCTFHGASELERSSEK